MKKYWSQIANLAVKLDADSNELGCLNGVFIHPDNGQIIGFLVGVLKVLVPIDVSKWSSNEVIITESEALMAPTELYRLKECGMRRAFFNRKRVYSKGGHRYGAIRDFRLDLTINQLISFDVSKKLLGIEWAKRQFTFRDIDHITDTKVILVLEPEGEEPLAIHSPVPST